VGLVGWAEAVPGAAGVHIMYIITSLHSAPGHAVSFCMGRTMTSEGGRQVFVYWGLACLRLKTLVRPGPVYTSDTANDGTYDTTYGYVCARKCFPACASP